MDSFAFMEGEHALSKPEYNATDLLVELDSFKEKRVTKLFLQMCSHTE